MSVKERMHIQVSGLVQGVGFRPFIYNLALRHNLSGFVRNIDGLVEIEAQGEAGALRSFREAIETQAPPLSHVDSINSVCKDIVDCEIAFEIIESTKANLIDKVIPPDAATCADCLHELFDRQNRRFGYPFINCTNCGPRFTIIHSLPYDREATTMRHFQMCAQCRSEYDDPSNRRFHAQPNACHLCGPQLSWVGERSRSDPEGALCEAVAQLESGMIVAVKGLGGFHLMCDATANDAVARLRGRKVRDKKPFALMMTDLEMVRDYCHLSAPEERELQKPSRPILLLRRKDNSELSGQIASSVARLGVMLPYTPVHHLLLSRLGRPLVATSANVSQEPIVIENDDALTRLSGIADGFLQHNRDISRRYDDSIVQQIDEPDDRFVVLRRSRGMAPLPLRLPWNSSKTVLAFGPHLKNTFCLIRGNQAYLSQHIGDLENLETENHFEQSLDSFLQMFDLKPELIAHDCHPDYMSTRLAQSFARRYNLPSVAIQHHHAHITACMAEHGLSAEVIGVAFDGLGWGTDETLWGGEFFVCDLAKARRVGYLSPLPMPGGAQAVKQPWRMSLAQILALPQSDRHDFAPYLKALEAKLGAAQVKTVSQQCQRRLNSPLTSSCGRLFDAVSALLDICPLADYEGQAAMELERQATCWLSTHRSAPEPYILSFEKNDAQLILDTGKMFAQIWQDVTSGTPVGLIAARFHQSIAEIIVQTCVRLRSQYALDRVCLGGGVFQNSLLLSTVVPLLESRDFQVYFPCQAPINDGGISLGQAVTALASVNALTTV